MDPVILNAILIMCISKFFGGEMIKKIKYEYLACLLIIVWGITFFVVSEITVKDNFRFMNKINFILQFLEITSLTVLNLVNRNKRKFIFYVINILLIVFFICIFFLPMWGEDPTFKIF